ncbi:MAG: DNA translocase FtsK 4TM domain-containing protein, partial [Anaerolineaceae bacterium]|nr:DNA translocase FtsK 4TM domain-containing protein [Anaerolineaceae bacterium]
KPGSTAKSRKVNASGKAAGSRQARKSSIRQPRWEWRGLSRERKLDLVGVLIALAGLLSLISLLSGQGGSLTDAWARMLYTVVGWGAPVLPLGLMFLGGWLALRNLERLPLLTAERMAGIVLLYLNLLSWLHALSSGGWELAQTGAGGGFVGGFFERLLVSTVGQVGTWIALSAWTLVSLVFTLDLSVPELARQIVAAVNVRKPQPQPRAESAPERLLPLAAPPATFRQIKAVSLHTAPAVSSPADTTSPAQVEPVEPSAQTPAEPSAWKLPPMEAILDPATPNGIRANTDQHRARILEETLASFGAPAHVVEIHRGPTITQFGLEPDYIETRSGRTRVRVAKISALADDLALALAAPSIRIQAPVPGRRYVGIEVPNTEISRVTLREIMESEHFLRMRSPLRFALGKDVSGKAAAYDLAAMPHLLIAGTTGSGKSVCVNAILCCFLLNNTPTELRLVLVDPKRVELTGYNG